MNSVHAVVDRARGQATRNLSIEFFFENWAWHASFGHLDGLPAGLPTRSIGIENYRSYDDHSESALERNDRILALKLDEAMSELTEVERAAISNRYLAKVWRFREEESRVEARAKAKIVEVLRRKGVWL